MQRLLAPDGCPWDREQTLETLVPYLVEETYEVVDAIADGRRRRPPRGAGRSAAADRLPVRAALRRGEVRHRRRRARHRRQAGAPPPARLRRRRRQGRRRGARELGEAQGRGEGRRRGKHGALDGIPRSAPALLRATRAGEKAGAVGFDWPDADGPRAKVDEELRELDEARARAATAPRWQRELGDVLFALVNLARKLGLDAEQALRDATDRFAQRFRHVEQALDAEGRAVADAGPEEQERLWQAAKRDRGSHRGKVAAPCQRRQARALRLDAAAPGRAQASKDKASREAMYRAELEERAALLHRLGHGKEQTRARLAANLAWDFAPDASPLTPAVLDAIVDRVYGQATPTAHHHPQRRNEMRAVSPTLGVAALATMLIAMWRRRERPQRSAEGSRHADAEAGPDDHRPRGRAAPAQEGRRRRDARVAVLTKKLESLGQDVSRLETERGNLGGELQQAQKRMEELRKAQVQAEARAAQFRKLVRSSSR